MCVCPESIHLERNFPSIKGKGLKNEHSQVMMKALHS